jgi:hypothetical protein
MQTQSIRQSKHQDKREIFINSLNMFEEKKSKIPRYFRMKRRTHD